MINLFSEVLGVSKMEAKYLQMLSAIELLLLAVGLSGGGSLFMELGQSIPARDGFFWLQMVVLWSVNGLLLFQFLK